MNYHGMVCPDCGQPAIHGGEMCRCELARQVQRWKAAYLDQSEMLEYIDLALSQQGIPGAVLDIPERLDSLIRMLNAYRERAVNRRRVIEQFRRGYK